MEDNERVQVEAEPSANSQLTPDDMRKLGFAAFWCDSYVNHRNGEESLPTIEEAEDASKMIREVMESTGPAHVGSISYKSQLFHERTLRLAAEAKVAKLTAQAEKEEQK